MPGIYDSVQVWKSLLTQGLEDDDWNWDWTTLGTLRGQVSSLPRQGKSRHSPRLSAYVIAKEAGVWAASPLVDAVNEHPEAIRGGVSLLTARSRWKDGQKFKAGDVLVEWTGTPRLLLAFERPFLNLASYVCGIATRTRLIVDAVEQAWPKSSAHQPPRITSTRKTLPGYRDLAIHAVQSGGGVSHRISLSGGVLIKENHIAAAGGIASAIRGVKATAPHGLKIEIEVRDLSELGQAVSAGADVVMLDNFSPKEVRVALSVLAKAKNRPLLEVSGGLRPETVAEYAIEGVDVLSVGSLTHSVRATDFSMLMSTVRKPKKVHR